MYVSPKPSRALNASLDRSRSRATFSMFTSTAFHARADTSNDRFMCSAINPRICGTGMTSSPPMATAGAGIGTAGTAAGAGAAGAGGAAAASTSFFVIRPPVPVPCTRARSTPCSAASLRTSGDRICDRGPRSGSFAACAEAVTGAEVAEAGATDTRAPAPAASPSITANSVPTDTVAPSGTRILVSVPEATDGTSVSTLSVEISNSGSSSSTVSPPAFSHFRIVPSTTVSPSWGIFTDVMGPPGSPRRELVHGIEDVGYLRQVRVLEGGGEGDRHVRRRQAHDRRVEVLEGLLGDHRGDLGADAEEPVTLVQHEGAAGLRHRLEHGLRVERLDRAQVHDLGRDALRREHLRGLERLVRHHPVRHDRDVRARAPHERLADRHEEVGVLGHELLDAPVDPLVLEEHDRVVVADRGLQQALRVARERRADHLQAGRVCEPRLGVERVEAARAHAAAPGRAG